MGAGKPNSNFKNEMRRVFASVVPNSEVEKRILKCLNKDSPPSSFVAHGLFQIPLRTK